MKKSLRVSLYIILGLVAILAIGLIYLLIQYPDIEPAPEIQIATTPDRIARGRYLANHVAVCVDCHSTRDWSRWSGPIQPGSEGMGGEYFGPELGFPGSFYAANITPHKETGIGNWSDGELVRLITTGVTRDGRAIFPVMPYPLYRHLATEDVYAIVAYLRTLQPRENQIEPTKLNFPVNLIVRTIPEKADPRPIPDPANQVAYGEYLATVAACTECHTRKEGGKAVGAPLAGGFEFQGPWGLVRSSNITPHVETGIGSWDRDTFIQRFAQYRNRTPNPVAAGKPNTVMPWTMYAGMQDADLAAIYAYLQSVPAVQNEIKVFEATP